MFSKLIKIISAASLFLVLGVAMTVSPTAYAQTVGQPCSAGGVAGVYATTNSGTIGCNTGTAGGGKGLVPGANVICASTGGVCPITNSVPKDSASIVVLLISIARFLSYISVGIAVIVIIYGGFLYLNPTDAKGAETGQRVLTQAAIGLAIALTAVTIVTIISQLLTGSWF
jgi:Type IV secretion system pilin